MSDLDLARRAVACRGWCWMRGSVTTEGLRVISVDDRGKPSAFIDYNWNLTTWCNGNVERELRGELPNFNDPATRGCLLQLVRERWGDDYACVVPIDYGPGGIMWVCSLTAGGKQLTTAHFTNETAALVAALEAAEHR